MRKVVEYKVVGEDGGKYKFFFIAGAALVLIIVVAIAIAVHQHNKSDKEVDIEAGVKGAVNLAEDVARDVVVGEEGKVESTSHSSLKDVVEINKLQTFSYTYNSICPFTSAQDGHMLFYVAYEGAVTFSVDTNDIKVITDDEEKFISLYVPDLTKEYTVNAGTLDIIFIDESYESNTEVPSNAYKAALKNLEAKAEMNDYMLELARSNTEHELEALITPIVTQMFGRDYEVRIAWNLEDAK